ncbi:hypothetical protein FRX31_020439 [Thalictrum thalictroides]|uniref:No apical meristem-associated C-terminal domain-containing protein n=1 Tax=Thalictrum thalictroides TaxID=46969 RepID=A0A7J6VYN4_THATH|nr:hypothetical protein FRX31_020439 [Thalictrum thalictroides]
MLPEGTPIQTQVGAAPSGFFNIASGPLPPERPGGRKTVKEKRKVARQESASSEVSSARVEYAAQLTKVNEATVKELALKKWNIEWKMKMYMQMEEEKAQLADERRIERESNIMMMDPSKIEDPIRKQYWMDLQKEIFERRHKQINDFSPQFSGFSPCAPDDFWFTGGVFGPTSGPGGFGPGGFGPSGFGPSGYGPGPYGPSGPNGGPGGFRPSRPSRGPGGFRQA